MDPLPPASAVRRPNIRCWTVPAAALIFYSLLAALWHWGPRSAYFAILRLFAFEPLRLPFLDIQAVLAAAQCNRAGLDIYTSNPCDALGRPDVYPPLWLTLAPSFLDTGDATAVGLAVDLLFILSLAAICRPTSAREGLVMALLALSPITVYALERANNDLIVFMLILTGCGFLRVAGAFRFAAYVVYVIAALLKYYPLACLVMLARESRRGAILAAAIVAAVLLALIAGDRTELAKAMANIPTPSYYTDSFAAVNLPFGLAAGLALPSGAGFGFALLAVLGGLALLRARRLIRLLNCEPPAWNSFAAECLIAGAVVLIACFFVARNTDYRGIYFVLVMPGLIGLRRICRRREVRRLFSQMISAVIFVSWEEPLRRSVQMAAAGMASAGLRLRVEDLFWLGRELVWWWLIAALAAMVFCYLRQLPLARAVIVALPQAWPRRRRRKLA